MNPEDFRTMQSLPYEYKTQHALNRAREFYEYCELIIKRNRQQVIL